MCKLVPVKYAARTYPQGISPQIQEVAAHFDCSYPNITLPEFSLHTEYSYGARDFCSSSLKGLSALTSAQRDGIPMLWLNKDWALQFADYIRLLSGDRVPTVIEIHPPYSDYQSLSSFVELYRFFEERVHLVYPQALILIENRNTSNYRGGRFALAKKDDFLLLGELIEQKSLSLGLAMDFPQLLNIHSIGNRKREEMADILNDLTALRPYIQGIHLWGKKISPSGRRVAHQGNLDDFFFHNPETKELFLQQLFGMLNDGLARYFVPEVNSNDKDLAAIVEDLLHAGFMFC